MSIATRKAGTITVCPRCGSDTQVPEFEQEQISDGHELQQSDPHQQSDEPQESEHEPSRSFEPESSQPVATVLVDQHDEKHSVQLACQTDDEDEEESDFELRRSSTDFDELDMTPMVDVTFLLLIFFMVTASFSIQKSIEVPVPDPDQEGVSQTIQPLEEMQETSILIEIDEENRFFVESEQVNDPRDLPIILAEVRSRESKNEVIVSVDKRAAHQSMVTAIDAAQEVGMQRIRWGVNSDE